MSTLLTQMQLNELKKERDLLLQKRNKSNINSYCSADDLSPREYLALSKEIEILNKKIEEATIFPKIKINQKFLVKINNSVFSMIITTTPVKMKNTINCSYDSPIGKAILGKTIGDILTIETDDSIAKYEIINIEEA